MNIRTALACATCALLMGVAPSAVAGSMSLNGFEHHVLPVLVTVNDQGKITAMSPAYPLRRPMRRLVRTTLDRMVTGPAISSHGEAMASMAVIDLALKATLQKDGRYKVKFVYAGAAPVPYGSWYWNHIDGHRLTLMNDNMRFMDRHHWRFRHASPRMYRRPRVFSNPVPAARPMPAAQMPTRSSTQPHGPARHSH